MVVVALHRLPCAAPWRYVFIMGVESVLITVLLLSKENGSSYKIKHLIKAGL